MKPALLLVDVQHDFLEREGLQPEAARLIPPIERLLTCFRRHALPVFHIHTLVKSDGSDRMPHWQLREQWACIEGTHGATPPPSLVPMADEPVIRKRFFSGFESGELHQALRSRGIDTVVIAGLFTHGCIRATALDAYALSYAVRIAEDSIASSEPTHAEISQQWMNKRGLQFLPSSIILSDLGFAADPIDVRLEASRWQHFNPARTSELWAEIVYADADAVDTVVRATSRAQADWVNSSIDRRAEILNAWAGLLNSDRANLARLLAEEIGKPLNDALEEVERTISHIAASVRSLRSTARTDSVTGSSFRVYDRPVGTVAIITPWNNPLAIPAGKIAPALAFGNGIVWKPALPASRSTQAAIEHLNRAGLPPDLLRVVAGDSVTARDIIAHPGISAVSFTGSNRTGAQVASLCGLLGKPFQAELGGNNAAIVLADADLALAAHSIAVSAFGFAGQRCTATRRIIVENSIREPFLKLLIPKVEALVLGDPLEPATQVGPLISRAHLQRVTGIVECALTEQRGRLLCGGTRPSNLPHGHWFSPTLIEGVAPDAPIVQEETFGPVAVIQTARDFVHAMALCNGVEQGLVANLFSRDVAQQQRFVRTAQAGILRINPTSFPVHPDAPFLGWKSSGIGPAEHGRWDLEFYTRPQAVYGMETSPSPIRSRP